jgi:hypothetical protein
MIQAMSLVWFFSAVAASSISREKSQFSACNEIAKKCFAHGETLNCQLCSQKCANNDDTNAIRTDMLKIKLKCIDTLWQIERNQWQIENEGKYKLLTKEQIRHNVESTKNVETFSPCTETEKTYLDQTYNKKIDQTFFENKKEYLFCPKTMSADDIILICTTQILETLETMGEYGTCGFKFSMDDNTRMKIPFPFKFAKPDINTCPDCQRRKKNDPCLDVCRMLSPNRYFSAKTVRDHYKKKCDRAKKTEKSYKYCSEYYNRVNYQVEIEAITLEKDENEQSLVNFWNFEIALPMTFGPPRQGNKRLAFNCDNDFKKCNKKLTSTMSDLGLIQDCQDCFNSCFWTSLTNSKFCATKYKVLLPMNRIFLD